MMKLFLLSVALVVVNGFGPPAGFEVGSPSGSSLPSLGETSVVGGVASPASGDTSGVGEVPPPSSNTGAALPAMAVNPQQKTIEEVYIAMETDVVVSAGFGTEPVTLISITPNTNIDKCHLQCMTDNKCVVGVHCEVEDATTTTTKSPCSGFGCGGITVKSNPSSVTSNPGECLIYHSDTTVTTTGLAMTTTTKTHCKGVIYHSNCRNMESSVDDKWKPVGDVLLSNDGSVSQKFACKTNQAIAITVRCTKAGTTTVPTDESCTDASPPSDSGTPVLVGGGGSGGSGNGGFVPQPPNITPEPTTTTPEPTTTTPEPTTTTPEPTTTTPEPSPFEFKDCEPYTIKMKTQTETQKDPGVGYNWCDYFAPSTYTNNPYYYCYTSDNTYWSFNYVVDDMLMGGECKDLCPHFVTQLIKLGISPTINDATKMTCYYWNDWYDYTSYFYDLWANYYNNWFSSY